MKTLRKLLTMVVAFAMVASTMLAVPVNAAETVTAKIFGKIEDNGQHVYKAVIDYGNVKVSGVEKDTYKVHVKATTEGMRPDTETAYGDYEGDRTIAKVVENGTTVEVYFDLSDGKSGTLSYLAGGARNIPSDITYTITQEKAVKATAMDGKDLGEITEEIAVVEGIIDEETTAFESVEVEGGINYQLHKGTNDTLIVWFHGNGEGDYINPETGLANGNNVAQMLANRGTVAWTTEEAQEVFGDATVMAFQAPDTWYYAQRDGLLEKAGNEIKEVMASQGIDPEKVYVSGCSAGGYMTTRMIIAHPELFKAAMINCPALDVASARGGETPTDEELASIKESDTAIWLVQGQTDASVATDACSKRMFSILTEGADLTTTRVDQEIQSGFTTQETKDGKYKLSLYDTTEDAKLVFEGDNNQDGELEEIKYSNHWSWIYTLRNNPQDASGTHIWQWAASYDQEGVVAGTQKAYIVGDDWGPAVTKTIIKLNKTVDAESVDAEDFKVVEEKTATNWGSEASVPFGGEYLAKAERKVLGAYTSDAEGNEVDGDSQYVTVEMYVSPNDGSPFIYSLATGLNRWCDVYKLHVTLTGELTAEGKEVSVINVPSTIDVAGEGKICPQLDLFTQKSFTTKGGKEYSYADFAPAEDEGKNALVVWLHGAGEGGYVTDTDLLANEVTAFAGEEFQEAMKNAYVLAPQCPTMWMDDGTGAYQNGDKGSVYAEDLFEIIDTYVKANPDIDTDRIYIGGCSNGGYMTMEMILNNPTYFAAAFPICEAFYDEFITDEQIEAIKDMPIWFTYAKNDGTVDPTKCTEPTVKRLLAAGAKNVHVSAFDDVRDTSGRFTDAEGNPHQYDGHWSWIYFDNNECTEGDLNAWVWLGQQTKAIEEPEEDSEETEEDSEETEESEDKVQTGDNAAVMAATMGMLVAGAAIVALRRKED